MTYSNKDKEEEEDDEEPKLSRDTLAALQDFYNDRDIQEKRFQELQLAQESNPTLTMDMFTEDWNASQFWYNDETAAVLAKEMLDKATANTCVAVISAPSVFIQIKNLLASRVNTDVAHSPELYLLEFDDRFALLKEFVHYDFRSPLKLPLELRGKFDHIICDPPFLNADCQIKVAMTVRWLLKPSTPSDITKPCHRTIVCTGERMESLVLKIFPGTYTTTFEPQHTQGRLSNEFRCYANYECDAWSWL